jgi:hypothetical protein
MGGIHRFPPLDGVEVLLDAVLGVDGEESAWSLDEQAVRALDEQAVRAMADPAMRNWRRLRRGRFMRLKVFT